MVLLELERLGLEHVTFNQRHFARTQIELEISNGVVGGWLQVAGASWPLEGFAGVYTRMVDVRLLPELAGQPEGAPSLRSCQGLHDTLVHWADIAPARVVNRTRPMATNSSKPYQAQLIRAHGLSIPETLITNDPALVIEFVERHGQVVFKSVSGVRSILRTLEREDLARLDRIRWCPVQFQAFVEGSNVRVHVIGAQVLATAIETTAIDYRYAGRLGGEPAALAATELPDELAERCVRLAGALGLDFAGIDLKITPEGEAFCFEVNPSPAFSYYEGQTGQPIARAVASYLAGRGGAR